MRAAFIESLGGPGSVRVREVPAPAEDTTRVRIQVGAAGVSFPDVLATRGTYQLRPPMPYVPGLELAGTVVAAPAQSGFVAGDRVAAYLHFGAFAEVVDVIPAHVVALPDSTDLVTGAALVVNHLTAHYALTRRGRLQAGETVLIHGAAGGVGVAATQVAKALGARVLAVVSTPEKAAVARACGADEVLSPDTFLAEAVELLGKKAVDVVLDPVGGERFTDSVRSLAREGRLVVIGFAAGEIPSVRANRLLLGNCAVMGAAWAEFVDDVPDYVQEQWAELAPQVADGTYAPVVGTVAPIEEVAEVLRAWEERRLPHKAVLTF